MTAFNKTSVALAIIILSLLCSCASTTKTKVLSEMAAAGILGVVAGQQRQEDRMAFSVMYAGLAAATAGAIGVIVHDPDKEFSILKSENADLKQKLDEAFTPRLEKELPGTLTGKVPDKYRALIQPGQWRVYELDQWIEEDENRLIHQDKIMELIPPSLKALQKPVFRKEKR